MVEHMIQSLSMPLGVVTSRNLEAGGRGGWRIMAADVYLIIVVGAVQW